MADSGLMECKWPVPEHMDHFDSNELRIEYQSLRIPLTKSVASLTERPGYLRLKGKESLSSPYQQSLIARRQIFAILQILAWNLILRATSI